jgi:hypothetical protein
VTIFGDPTFPLVKCSLASLTLVGGGGKGKGLVALASMNYASTGMPIRLLACQLTFLKMSIVGLENITECAKEILVFV